MATQPRLILLQKTMVVVEGVARALDPDLDIWVTSEPVVREWIEGNLGPAAKLREIGDSVAAAGRFGLDLPRLVAQAERLSAGFAAMADRGLRLDQESIERLMRSERASGRTTAVAIWIAALSLAALAVHFVW